MQQDEQTPAPPPADPSITPRPATRLQPWLNGFPDYRCAEVFVKNEIRRIAKGQAGGLNGGGKNQRLPGADLVSHWAYMVIAALAWKLQAWPGLLTPHRERGLESVQPFIKEAFDLGQAFTMAGEKVEDVWMQESLFRIQGY